MSKELKAALRERLDQNYNTFLESLQGKTASELIVMAPEITAAQQVHEELLDACSEEDMEFLLQFSDPLEVVRGYWESEITGYSHGDEMGHMLWDIQDKKMYSEEQLIQPEKDAGKFPSSAAQSKKTNEREVNTMGQDAMTEDFEHIELFGKSALFSNFRIDRSTVPDGWHCYDLRGSDYDPGMPVTLELHVVVNHAGTILSPEEITFAKEKNYRRIKGKINFLGDSVTVAEFCKQHQFPDPVPAMTAKIPHKKNRSKAYER